MKTFYTIDTESGRMISINDVTPLTAADIKGGFWEMKSEANADVPEWFSNLHSRWLEEHPGDPFVGGLLPGHWRFDLLAADARACPRREWLLTSASKRVGI